MRVKETRRNEKKRMQEKISEKKKGEETRERVEKLQRQKDFS